MELVSQIEVTAEYIVLSFNVASLFTSVFVHLAIPTIRISVEEGKSMSEGTNLSVYDLRHLLELCHSSTYVRSKGEHFKPTS